MNAAFKRTVAALFTGPAAWLYMAFLCAVSSASTIVANLYQGDLSFAAAYQDLCLALVFAVPLLTLNAFPGEPPCAEPSHKRFLGCFLAHLALHTAACALTLMQTLLVFATPECYILSLGLWGAGAAMIALSLLIVLRVKNRGLALLATGSFALFCHFVPEISGVLAFNGLGALVGRALIWLSPLGRMSYFLSGLCDLTALGLDAVYCVLSVGLSQSGRGGRLSAIALCAVLLLALVIQPVTLTRLDVTQSGVTTMSDDFLGRMRGLTTQTTVYQVAPVGEEDPWVYVFLQKLSERHAYLDFQSIAPSENARIAELDLPANSLIVENGEEWSILRADVLYSERYGLVDGHKVSFELEGALLTALSDATGIDLIYDGVPSGKILTNAGLTLPDLYASGLLVAFLALPPMLALIALVRLWRKRKHIR